MDEKLDDLGKDAPRKGVFLEGNKILHGFMFMNLITEVISSDSNNNYQVPERKLV